METLPPEMLEEIGRLLTPRDLARCCGVSRGWREIFNQNLLWRPHCDPALVEPLDTTPCVVEPVFVSPESETSTLTPISHWRLAFLKQKHLWKNWKHRTYKREDILKLAKEVCTYFLSSTLIVRWCKDRIEIWNVSVIPATFLAKVDLEHVYYCNSCGIDGLFVKLKDSVKIFHVNPFNKQVIELKHTVPLEDQEPVSLYSMNRVNLVKDSLYVCVDTDGLSLHIIDLEKGNKIMVYSPVVQKYKRRTAKIFYIKNSSTSDNVIVLVYVPWSEENNHYYIYSLGRSTFLPGPVHKQRLEIPDLSAIQGDYLAVGDRRSLRVYDCLTSECIFTKDFNSNGIEPYTFNSSIIFIAHGDCGGEGLVGVYSLSNKTLEVILKHSEIDNETCMRIINDKFVTIFGNDSDDEVEFGVWEASGQTLKRSDIPAIFYDHDINEAFTRGIDCKGRAIYYYW